MLFCHYYYYTTVISIVSGHMQSWFALLPEPWFTILSLTIALTYHLFGAV